MMAADGGGGSGGGGDGGGGGGGGGEVLLALCLGSRPQEVRRALPLAHAAVQRLVGDGAATDTSCCTDTGGGVAAVHLQPAVRAIVMPVVASLAEEVEAAVRRLEWPVPVHVSAAGAHAVDLACAPHEKHGAEVAEAAAAEAAEAAEAAGSDGCEARRLAVLAAADVALAVSGTVALELGAVGVPTVVIYPAGRVTGWVARRMAHVRFASLLNIMGDSEVVPELLFERGADADAVAGQLRALLPVGGDGDGGGGGVGGGGAAEVQRQRVCRLLPHLLCWSGRPGAQESDALGGSRASSAAAADAIWALLDGADADS